MLLILKCYRTHSIQKFVTSKFHIVNIFVKFFLFILILLIGFFGLAFYWTFYKPLPKYDNELELPGLQAEVDIHWDSFGVPHIYANNEEDLYFAMGYVHAQDRLWQMTLSQIAAEGRFAEYFGGNGTLIELDKYHRTLGYWNLAEKLEKEVISDRERDLLQAYSDGVNTFIDENHNRLPVEFSLTEIEPIRWNPVRSLALNRMIGWQMNMSWWSEVTYGYLQSILSSEQFEELMLQYPDNAPTSIDDAASMGAALLPFLQSDKKLRETMKMEGTHVGSNGWVVDRSKTDTGYPMLAGDPHLGLFMPGFWYEVHLNLNGKNVSGGSLPGIPLVVIGQNDNYSWTMTSMMNDDIDFYLEQVDPKDRGRYVVDSLASDSALFESFNRKREIIKVKGKDDISIEIRYTKHGPVISDIYPTEELVGDKVISMRWSGFELTNEFRAFYEINWGESFQDFKDALPHYGIPGMNFIYGDVEGNIAMYSAAKLPILSGNPITIREGWEPENDWQGFIPFEELPKVINPKKGWIANANNKIATDSYPYYLATFWEPPSRIERIEQFLNENEILTPQLFAELQNDSYSSFAARLTPVLVDILQSQDEYNFDMVVSYLSNWNFRYEKSSTAASIFDTFMVKLSENTFKDEFGEHAYSNFIHHENIPVRTLTGFLLNDSSFFDNVETEEVESKADMVLQSMQDAIYFLSDSLGSEPFEWRWERLHTVTFEQPLFALAASQPNAPKSLSLIVDNILSKGPFAVESHGMSVNNGQYKWEEPFKMTLGPSMRRIVDFSHIGSTQTILTTGQSGNPLSQHYGDQIELWLNGQYKQLHQDSLMIEQEGKRTTKLRPVNL